MHEVIESGPARGHFVGQALCFNHQAQLRVQKFHVWVTRRLLDFACRSNALLPVSSDNDDSVSGARKATSDFLADSVRAASDESGLTVEARNHGKASVVRRTDFKNSCNALPISWGESSCRKCKPLTVTSVWFGQVRQNSSTPPLTMAPGSPTMRSLG